VAGRTEHRSQPGSKPSTLCATLERLTMARNKINPLNRRLTKAEVKNFIDNGAKFHEEYSKDYHEKYKSGNEKQDLIYELANGDFIFVFDPKGHVYQGKGNYYSRDSFLKFHRWQKQVSDDHRQGRGSDIEHWLHYSKQGIQLFNNKLINIEVISKELDLDKKKLDFSYKSLGVIDVAIENYPSGKAWETLYDALVFYVGEIIINRVSGQWQIESIPACDYPYVTIKGATLHYMPIKIIWQEIDGLNPCNLRKATADEVITNSFLRPKNNS